MPSDQTQSRRDRVLQLFGKPDRAVAQILIEEGHEPDSGAKPRTKAAIAEWELRRLSSMSKTVQRDREWWREQWKKRKPKAGDDLNSAREEYLAELGSDIDDIHELIDDSNTRATAKAILAGTKARFRELRAKAMGVYEVPVADPDADKPRPMVIGLVIGTQNVSADTRAMLKAQGVEFEED